MEAVVDGGVSRFEGRATTADGWRIRATEYFDSHTKDTNKGENKISFASVDLTHLATDEDMTAAAALVLKQQMNASPDNRSAQ